MRRGRPGALASSATRYAALAPWIDLFVDFLVTKHGLAAALRSDAAGFETLHAYFLDRLVPVCARCSRPRSRRARSGPTSALRAHARGRQPLHRGGATTPATTPRRMVALLVAGLRR